MKLYKLSLMIVSAVMFATATVSCDDDDVKPTQLEMSNVSVDNVSYNSMSFKWSKVPSATQYSCQLSDDMGVVDTKVVNTPSVTFCGLNSSTDYTITVLAYAAPYGDLLTSEPMVLQERTTDLIVLDKPQLVVDRLGNNLSVSWNDVAGAQSYTYSVTKDGDEYESGTVDDTVLTFKSLETATYVISVASHTDRGGYADSESSVVSVDFVWEDPIAWSVTGTFTSEYLNDSWPVTLIAYTDGTYTLKNWYNVEGYDLSFSIDESTPDDMFVLPDDTEYDDGWPVIYTGRTSSPTSVYLYPWDNYCRMSVDTGYLELTVYVSDYCTDTFTWNPSDVIVGN